MKRIKLKSKHQKPRLIEQWIEVRVRNNQTVTEYYPSNLEFDKMIREADPKPDLVYRRFTFLEGVPPEYNWTGPPATTRINGGHFIVRMLPQDWPAVYIAEAAGKGHAIPTPRPQPRPEYFGPCPCDRCTTKREQQQAA